MNKLAIEINDILRGHYPSRGMKVSMGETCQCGYWTGNEKAGYDRPVGVVNALDWHRANLIAEFIEAGEK